MPSFISEYEDKTITYIENRLNESYQNKPKVLLWADAFNTESSTNTRTQIFFGHQRTIRDGTTNTPQGKKVYRKKYIFEIRVEVYTLKNHQYALNLIEYILDDILASFKPFNEFSAFTPEESGQAFRNRNNSSWVYSGTGSSYIWSDVLEISDKELIPSDLEGKIIEVKLLNANSQDEQLIGGFRP